MDYDDLKQLREAAKEGRAQAPVPPKDAQVAARAQSEEVGRLEGDPRAVTVDGGDREAERSLASGRADAATLQALSGRAEALPHQERLAAVFGAHEVGSVQAHTDERAQATLDALGARGLAAGDRVAVAADADVAEVARQAALALAHQAEARGQEGVAETAEREALVQAIGERAAAGRDAEDLLDRLTGEADGRGDRVAAGGGGAYDGVGTGERDGAEAEDLEADEDQEGELDAEAQAEVQARAEAEAREHAAHARPWFETVRAGLLAVEAVSFDPPPLHARRRKRVGEGWLFDLPGPALAPARGGPRPHAADPTRRPA